MDNEFKILKQVNFKWKIKNILHTDDEIISEVG